MTINASLIEMQKALRDTDRSGFTPVRVSVLRNITVETIQQPLEFLGLGAGLDISLTFGGYDNVVPEALSGGDLFETDAVVVFTKLETLSMQLSQGFAALDEAGINAELDRLDELFATVLGGIRSHTSAPVLWYGFEPPVDPALGVHDASSEFGQTATIARLNKLLRERCNEAGGCSVIDAGAVLARVGVGGYYDNRYWHMGKAPYGPKGAGAIAEQLFRAIRATRGGAKKCLVLDCDNTLWGGIVGEDGIDGIKLGPDHPGSAFVEFQRAALDLFNRGVMLALCSKNNEADVWEVFDNHPHMALRRKHIASHRINWQDKASNLREIAAELNLGLDHLVFADDSDFEVNLVREALPQVTVMHLPSADTTGHRQRLIGCGLFDTLSLTAEDRARGKMYAAEAQRREAKTAVTDLGEYLRSLEIRLDLSAPTKGEIARVTQLTQRTNQFNLTTRRYAEAEIHERIEGASHSVLALRVADRFGDSGLVGVAILDHRSGETEIEAFMMSCRVLGRRIEDALLAACVAEARAKNPRAAVVGHYLPTKKNVQVERFYPDRGFAETADTGVYRLNADAPAPAPSDVFAEVRGMPAGDVSLESKPQRPVGAAAAQESER